MDVDFTDKRDWTRKDWVYQVQLFSHEVTAILSVLFVRDWAI